MSSVLPVTRARLLRGIHRAATVAVCTLAATAAGAQDSMRQYRFTPADDGYTLTLHETAVPVPAAGQVLVRVRATSLNRRDVLMLEGRYGPGGAAAGGIPLSDGAGEVVAVGSGVTRFAAGDRVAGIFFAAWLDGERTAAALDSARGGGPGGMLAEFVVTDASALVAIPAHLSFEEAATLPCAGVTAWVALFRAGDLQPGEFVLLEGTGGVSLFGLQFAAAAGAQPIITSSSDDKLARTQALGSVGRVNYRRNEDWQQEVRALTGGRGVDHVLEVGGQDTLDKAMQALAFDSHIALIGGLSGFAPAIPVGALMGLGASATGVYVGSRADFEAMNEFIAEHQIRPVVDRVFDFDEAPAAFDFMQNGSYFGKIVIRL